MKQAVLEKFQCRFHFCMELLSLQMVCGVV